MEWGARWYWAVATSVLVVPVGAVLAALTWTAYPATVAVLGMLSIIPLGFAVHLLLPWQLEGAMLWIAARWRSEEETIEGVLTSQSAACGRRARWAQGIVAALYVALMVWVATTTVPLDRQLAQVERADRLAAQITAGIDAPALEKTTVIFDGMLPDVAGNRLLLRAEEGTGQEAVEEIADAAASEAQRRLPAGEWLLSVWADDGGKVERSLQVGED
jgi:hypothetical protein